MSENTQSSFDDLRLESWEENALDRTESITDNFNEQARGEAAGPSDEDAANGSAGDQTAAAAADLQREPYEDEAAYDTTDDAAQEADYDDGYDGPGM